MNANAPDPAAEARGRPAFVAVVAAIGAVYGLLAVLAGRHLMLSELIWPVDVLFGFDIARNIEVMTQFSIARSNVHPLIGVMTRPFTALVRLAGVTQGMSAVIVTTGAGVLALWLTAFYLRLRGVRRVDTVLLVLLMASSMTWLFESAMPGTYIFSCAVLALTHIALARSLARQAAGNVPAGVDWPREAAWFVLGILNYGITVTMGVMWYIVYGLSRRGGLMGWARATWVGVLVLLAGVALSLAVGSWINIHAERQFARGGELVGTLPDYPVLRSASTSLVWGFVAPEVQLVQVEDARGWTIASFIKWDYTPLGWAAAGAWGALLAAGAWHALRQRGWAERRLNLALAGCLAFHIVLHGFYLVAQEGTFVFTAHSIFPVVGLLAPLALWLGGLPPRARWVFRAALLIFALFLTTRHIQLTWSLPEFVPLPAEYVDARPGE